MRQLPIGGARVIFIVYNIILFNIILYNIILYNIILYNIYIEYYIIFKLGLLLGIFAENVPKLLKKIRQNMKEFLNKTKTQL
jgi:hypothetical protein